MSCKEAIIVLPAQPERNPMPLAQGYDFTIEQLDEVITIELVQKATVGIRVFTQHSSQTNRLSRLKSHMESLTEVQCNDWIKPPRAVKIKPPKTA